MKTVRPYYNGQVLFRGRTQDEAAQLLAFDRGADDYIQRPVSPALLTARIRAHLRCSQGADGLKLRAGALVVDPAMRADSLSGQPIDLTTMAV